MKAPTFKLSLPIIFAILTMLFVINLPANAADKKDKAARRAALMMQKMKQDMEAEKAAMQAKFDADKKLLEDQLKMQEALNTDMDKQLKSSRYKVKQLKSEVETLTAKNNALEKQLAETKQNLLTTQKSLSDTQGELKQAQSDLKFNDNQRKTLASNLSSTTKALNSCTDKNGQLYAFGKELIQIYDDPSLYERVMRKESFFQLKRVELENILQNKLDKLDEARVHPH